MSNIETSLRSLQQLAARLEAEIRRLDARINDLRPRALAAPPDKPYDGQIVNADGDNWDPGSGRGQYQWDADLEAWALLDRSGAVIGDNLEDSQGNTLTEQDILNMLVGVDANLAPDPTFEQAVRYGLLRFWTTSDGGQVTIDADGGENSTPTMELTAASVDVETLSQRTMPVRHGDIIHVALKAFVDGTYDGGASDFAVRLETVDKNGANPTTQNPDSFSGAPGSIPGTFTFWEYTITIADTDAVAMRINPWLGSGVSSGFVRIEWLYVGHTEFEAEKTTGKDLSVLSGRTANKVDYTSGSGSVDAKEPAEANAEQTTGKSLTLLIHRLAQNIDYNSGGSVEAFQPQEAGANVTENRTSNDVQVGGGRNVQESGANNTESRTSNDVQVGGGRNVQESGANNTESRTSNDVQTGGGRAVEETGANNTESRTANDVLTGGGRAVQDHGATRNTGALADLDEVDTAQVTASAISGITHAIDDTPDALPTAAWTTVVSASPTLDVGSVLIDAATIFQNTVSGETNGSLRILRDSTLLPDSVLDNTVVWGLRDNPRSIPPFYESISPGTYTYELQVYVTSSNDDEVDADQSTLRITELKR